MLKKSLVEYVYEVCEDVEERNGTEGAYLTCKCPLHDDNNPSFVVYPNEDDQKSRWICLSGCGSGDIIDLIQAINGISFKEALKLATETLTTTATALLLVQKKCEKIVNTTSSYDERATAVRLHNLFKLYSKEETLRLHKRAEKLIEQNEYWQLDKTLDSWGV